MALPSLLLLLIGADYVRNGARLDAKRAAHAELIGGSLLASGLILLGIGIHLAFA